MSGGPPEERASKPEGSGVALFEERTEPSLRLPSSPSPAADAVEGSPLGEALRTSTVDLFENAVRLVIDADSDPTATSVVRAIAETCSELKNLGIERAGTGLILRCGSATAPILERTAPAEGPGRETVCVTAIIEAANQLLQKAGCRERFVPLTVDGTRESYIRASVSHAMNLSSAGLLELSDPEALLEFAAW